MTGFRTSSLTSTTSAWSTRGTRRAGIQVVFRGDPGTAEFIAFWVQYSRVLAGMNVNVWDVNEHVQALVRSGRPVAIEALRDPGIPLESLAV